NLFEIVGMCLSRFSRIPGDQNTVDWICPIERSVILRKSEDCAENRLDVLQRGFCKVFLFGDRAQHSTGIDGAKFSQANFADARAEVIDPDLAMALARAGSTFVLNPRQVSSLDESGQCDPRVGADPIAIYGLHE